MSVVVEDVDFVPGQEPDGLDREWASDFVARGIVDGEADLAKLLGVQRRVVDRKLKKIRPRDLVNALTSGDNVVSRKILRQIRQLSEQRAAEYATDVLKLDGAKVNQAEFLSSQDLTLGADVGRGPQGPAVYFELDAGVLGQWKGYEENPKGKRKSSRRKNPPIPTYPNGGVMEAGDWVDVNGDVAQIKDIYWSEEDECRRDGDWDPCPSWHVGLVWAEYGAGSGSAHEEFYLTDTGRWESTETGDNAWLTWIAEPNPKGKRMAKKRTRKRNACKKGEILIDREGYTRKGYTRKDGTRVKSTKVPASSFCVDDPGRPGRRARGAEKGPYSDEAAWIEDTGSLGGPGYTKKAAKTRHQILDRCVKNEGYRSCLGKIMVLLRSSELKQTTRQKLTADKNYLKKKYGGPGSFGARKNPRRSAKSLRASIRSTQSEVERLAKQYGSARRRGKRDEAADLRESLMDTEMELEELQDEYEEMMGERYELSPAKRSRRQNNPIRAARRGRGSESMLPEEQNLLLAMAQWQDDEGAQVPYDVTSDWREASYLELIGMADYSESDATAWLTPKGYRYAKKLRAGRSPTRRRRKRINPDAGPGVSRYAGHHHVSGDEYYVDTAFLNAINRLPSQEWSVRHMGFGEFVVEGPQGASVEVDRMRGRQFPGQSGRSHKLYDTKGGTKQAKRLIRDMDSAGLTIGSSGKLANPRKGKVARNPKPKFQVGDLVKYTTKFLRSTGQYKGVPIDGVVVGQGPLGPYVVWSDRDVPIHVNEANLQKKKSSRSRKDLISAARIATGLPLGDKGYAYTVYEGSQTWPGKVRVRGRFDQEHEAIKEAVDSVDRRELDAVVLDDEGVVVFSMTSAPTRARNPVPFVYGELLPEERELLWEMMHSDEDPYRVPLPYINAAINLDHMGYIDYVPADGNTGDEPAFLTRKGRLAGAELIGYARQRRRRRSAQAARLANP